MDDNTVFTDQSAGDETAGPTRWLADCRVTTLVFGLWFVVLGTMTLAEADPDPAWLWVGFLAAVGVGGIVAVLRGLVADNVR